MPVGEHDHAQAGLQLRERWKDACLLTDLLLPGLANEVSA